MVVLLIITVKRFVPNLIFVGGSAKNFVASSLPPVMGNVPMTPMLFRNGLLTLHNYEDYHYEDYYHYYK